MVSGTARPLCCPEFGGSQTGDLWCSLSLPSASAACGSGCPPAPAPSESTSPCRLSWRTMQDIGRKTYFKYHNQIYRPSTLTQGHHAQYTQHIRHIYKLYTCSLRKIVKHKRIQDQSKVRTHFPIHVNEKCVQTFVYKLYVIRYIPNLWDNRFYIYINNHS